MTKVRGAIVVDIALCKGCSLCVESCPTDVIQLANEVNAKGFHYAFMNKADECTGCTNCATVCPDSCIEVYRLKPSTSSL
jgi:2-oxoglutarate ferredoxin oxidoreductase subunit delta